MDDSLIDSVSRLWATVPTINTALPPPCLRPGQLNNKSTAKSNQYFGKKLIFLIFLCVVFGINLGKCNFLSLMFELKYVKSVQECWQSKLILN